MVRVGIAIEETWSFFDEIYKDLKEAYDTSLFERRKTSSPWFYSRINRIYLHRDLSRFMYCNDVVFFEWASELLVTASRLPKVCGIVTRLHRYELYQWANLVNWHAVDRIILVSRAMQSEFVGRFPAHASKTVVVPPSTSLDRFAPSTKAFAGNIGILCHLTPRKRVYDLILAFYELGKYRDDLHLHIAGGRHPSFDDYYEALHHLVRVLNLEDRVTFYGHIEDPSDWYREIDVFISNSYSEGLQVAPMEAMASGCYCLSHRWNGAEELLPEKYLYFSSSELERKILKYCDLSEEQKQAERQKMRARACKNFDINETVSAVRRVIEDVALSRTTQSIA